jgi:fructose-bisphosphate aldolase class II
MPEILRPAFEQRYGVAALNIVDDVTLRGVLDAAVAARSPVIIQVSVKTVRFWGARPLQRLFQAMAAEAPIPTTLHLDHCPDRAMISACLAAGWNSILFDASHLSYDACLRQTQEVVEEARRYGAAVEGEMEAVKGVEDGIGNAYGGPRAPLEQVLAFIRETGVDSFAAGVGTAHGLYEGEPEIDFQRASAIVAAEPIPLVLHGGTGLSELVLRELVARGEAKVNISTQLKMTMADSYRTYLTDKPTEYDPMRLLAHVRDEVKGMTLELIRILGSGGKAA